MKGYAAAAVTVRASVARACGAIKGAGVARTLGDACTCTACKCSARVPHINRSVMWIKVFNRTGAYKKREAVHGPFCWAQCQWREAVRAAAKGDVGNMHHSSCT